MSKNITCPEEHITCPKCKHISGDDWSQCNGKCPMVGSPDYDKETDNRYKENNMDNKFFVTVTSKYSIGDVFTKKEPKYHLEYTIIDGEVYHRKVLYYQTYVFTIKAYESVNIYSDGRLGLYGEVYLYVCNLKIYDKDNKIIFDNDAFETVKELDYLEKMEAGYTYKGEE